MKFFVNKKFWFKLIVCLCVCLSIWNFGMNVIVLGHSKEDHAGETPKEEVTKLGPIPIDTKYVFPDGCYYRIKGPTREKVWYINNPEDPDADPVVEYSSLSEDNTSSFEALTGLAGKLLQPIMQLCTALGDGVMNIIHKAIMGTESEIIVDTRTGFWARVAAVVAAIVVVAALIAITVGTAGATAGIGAILGNVIAGAIGSVTVPLALGAACFAWAGVNGAFMQEVTLLPLYTIGPEEIFKGDILLFDVNIFNPKEVYVRYGSTYGESDTMTVEEWTQGGGANTNRIAKNYFYLKDGDASNRSDSNIVITSTNDSAYELKNTIANWYYTIRNIAIIGLMLVLLYVGIRILLSSTASEKAKYKEMVKDWVIGICLVFLLQYIMVFAMNFTETITNLLSSIAGEQHHIVVIEEANEELRNVLTDAGFDDNVVAGNDIRWYTNLMGKIRVLAEEETGSTSYIGYALCFLVLVLYTVIFTFTYLKRLLYIMFLTIIAPLVALSYPLDKMRDGKAQAFDIWLKEYIFNLLIQPFHLLLYVVLVSMAIDLSSTNVIYSIVALGFMIPAEKFLRKMFGFDKASTPGFLGGAAGAALTMSAMHSLERFAGRGPGANRRGMPSGGKDENKKDFLNRSADSGHNNASLFAQVAAGKDDLKDDNNKNKSGKDKGKQEDDKNVPNPQDKKDLLDGDDKQELSEDEKKRQELQNNLEEAKQLADDSDTTEYGEGDREFAEANLAEAQKEWDEYNAEHGKDDLKDDKAEGNNGTGENDEETENSAKKLSLKEEEERKEKIEKAARARRIRGFVGRETLKTTGRVLRTGIKLTAGGVGGMIGAAAGIASGDPSAVIKNTAAGAYAGSAIGQGLTNTAVNLGTDIYKNGSAKRDEMKHAYYGGDYSSHMKREKDIQFARDKETRRKYMEDLGLDQIKDAKERKAALDRAMENAIKYRQEGITNDDIIIKAMKSSNKNHKYDENTAANVENIAAAKLANVTSNQKDYEANMKRFASTKGMSAKKVQDMDSKLKYITGL